MKEELISYETALLAKDKGFDEITEFWWEIGNGDIDDGNKTPCLFSSPGNSLKNSTLMKEYEYQGIRCGEFSAPTQSLLQRWLREKHDIQMFIPPISKDPIKYLMIIPKCYLGGGESAGLGVFETYEQALERGLQEALSLIKT